MGVYDDHRKRIAFNFLSNKLNFSKAEVMQYGDRMIFGFKCENHTYLATFTDRVWKIATIRPKESPAKNYERYYEIGEGEEIKVMCSEDMPVGAYTIIGEMMKNNILTEIYPMVFACILGKLKIGYNAKCVDKVPDVCKSLYGENMVILKNPSTGFEKLILREECGSLVLHYKLTKSASKSADDYFELITGAAYQYVDLVTSDNKDIASYI